MAEFLSVAALQDPDVLASRVEANEPVIGWDLSLPAHLDTEKIQINMSRLGALHRVGAFSASIVDEYHGETTESHNVTGINADGSAVAGISKTKQVEEHKSDIIDPDTNVPASYLRNFGKPIAKHSVNRSEAVQNVIALKEHDKTDEQAWSIVLDKAIRGSFRDAGKANLKDRIGNIRKLVSYGLAANVALSVAALPETNSGSILIIGYGGVHAFEFVTATFFAKKYLETNIVDQKRWSFFLDNQPDRYVALSGLSRMPGLVKSQ